MVLAGYTEWTRVRASQSLKIPNKTILKNRRAYFNKIILVHCAKFTLILRKVPDWLGAPGLERLPSLNNYRKLFREFINESRIKTLLD